MLTTVLFPRLFFRWTVEARLIVTVQELGNGCWQGCYHGVVTHVVPTQESTLEFPITWTGSGNMFLEYEHHVD